MATHTSVLAWRIPQTWEPSKLQPMRSHRVGHDWAIFTYSLMYRHLYVLFGCFSHIGSCRVLNSGPHAIQWVLLDYFIIRSVFMNQLISPQPLSFLVTISFFSMSVRLFLFRKDVHLYPFLIPPRDGNPLQCSCLEEGEPGGLPSMGSHRVRHNWSDLAVAEVISYNPGLFLSFYFT